jgi:hypothetical protein
MVSGGSLTLNISRAMALLHPRVKSMGPVWEGVLGREAAGPSVKEFVIKFVEIF